MAQQGPKRASSRRATSRESDVHEDEAWQLCQEVFEATAPGCLEKLHRRSLDLQVDVEVLEAPTLLQHREKGVTWLCQQFDKLGYRDEWFLSAVSLMDRASCAASAALNCKKEMSAAGLSKLCRVNAAKKAIQVEGFWVAAASLALNLTEVEAELECLDFQDLVKPFRQNAWQITMRTSGPKILSTTDFTASELCMMDLLEYRIQLPTAMDLLMEMCFGVRFALHSAGQDKSNVSWAGLQQARYPRIKGPGRAVVLSSLKAAITDRVQPQFVVLASFLLELLLVHKPAEAYKCSSPAAAAIAALELALHGFGTPPPEVCLQELQRYKERLVEQDQHDVMAALCQLWQRPPQGSAVMQKWLGRAATMFGGALPKAPKELVERIGRGKESIATPKAKSVLPAVASTPCRTAASADPKVDDPLATPPCLPMPPHKSKLKQAAQRTVAAVRLSPKGKKSVTPIAIRAAVQNKVSPVNKASLKRSYADDRKKAVPKAKTKTITQAQHMVVPEGLEVKLHEPLMVSLPTKEESELVPAKTQLHVEAKEERREPCPTQMVCQEPPVAALMDLTLEDSMSAADLDGMGEVKPDTALANVPAPACAADAVSSDVVVSDDEEDTEIAQAPAQKVSWSPKNLRIYSEPVQPLQSTEVYCHREAHRALSLERKAGEWKTASQWQDQQAAPVTVQHEGPCAQLEEEELFQPPVKRQRTDVANWNPTGRQSCKENVPPCPQAAAPRAVSISAGRGSSSIARERVARPKASAKKPFPLQPLPMPPKNIHENTRARKSGSRDQPLKQKPAAAVPRKPKAGTPLTQPKQVLCSFSVSAETAAAARKREDDQMRGAKYIRRSQSRPSQKEVAAAQAASYKALVRSR